MFLLIECLARLGLRPVFVSAVGSDPLGVMMLKHCEEVNMVRFCVPLVQPLSILLLNTDQRVLSPYNINTWLSRQGRRLKRELP